MLEFVFVFLLARKNGQIVEAKGWSPTKYQWGTAGLWFGCEILGFIIGMMISGPRAELLDLYPYGIVGVFVGGLASYLWAKQVPVHPARSWSPTHLAPPSGIPGWATPDGSQTPTAMIPGGAALVLVSSSGEWAMVRGVNGWTGWVDARSLQPRYAPPVFTTPAGE